MTDDRYDISGLPEARFEPGSNDQVLKNRLGIVSKQQMDDAEAKALQQVMDELIRKYDETHTFTAEDLCECHRMWLGNIYEWAGQYRLVNVSKDNFPFASAAQIPSLMEQFERAVLGHYTPCNFTERADIIHALAETHVELVLIHPFRDGNGRLSRVLSTLMALQGGLPLLDFRAIVGGKKKDYFLAIQAGLDKNYIPMQKLFADIIEQSLSGS